MAQGVRGPPAWLPAALELEARGLSRRAIARRLGVAPGTVLRGLWMHHTSGAKERERERGRRRDRKRGVRSIADRTAWTEAALTETWAARKLRLAAERKKPA